MRYVGANKLRLIYRGERYELKQNQVIDLPNFAPSRDFVPQMESEEKKTIARLEERVDEIMGKILILEKVTPE